MWSLRSFFGGQKTGKASKKDGHVPTRTRLVPAPRTLGENFTSVTGLGLVKPPYKVRLYISRWIFPTPLNIIGLVDIN